MVTFIHSRMFDVCIFIKFESFQDFKFRFEYALWIVIMHWVICVWRIKLQLRTAMKNLFHKLFCWSSFLWNTNLVSSLLGWAFDFISAEFGRSSSTIASILILIQSTVDRGEKSIDIYGQRIFEHRQLAHRYNYSVGKIYKLTLGPRGHPIKSFYRKSNISEIDFIKIISAYFIHQLNFTDR